MDKLVFMLVGVHSAFCSLVWEFLLLTCFFFVFRLIAILVFVTGVCLAAKVALIGVHLPAQCWNERAGMLRDAFRVFCLFVWEFLLVDLFFFVL